MCGIAGFVNRDGEAADRDVLARMTATLAHRGPDGDGFYRRRARRPRAIAGSRSSTSPAAPSRWPTRTARSGSPSTARSTTTPSSAPGSWPRGHVYRTDCDTESLVHLYEEHGADFARRLNGMFALAIWDAPRRRLVLARDRMGQKPLFYAETAGGGLVFGSEPKALLAHPESPAGSTRAGLARYLFYEYVPGPALDLGGDEEAPAGPRPGLGGRADRPSRRYWDVARPGRRAAARSRRPRRGSGTTSATAVGRHRRSDVPLGVFLSGGVDSSSVAAALAELEPAPGDPDVLDRLRRPELRRERPRPGRRPAPGDRPPRADLLGRDGHGAAARGRRLARRAVRRRLDPADPPAEPVRPRGGHGRPRRRRGRRAARRLPDVRGRAGLGALPAAAPGRPGRWPARRSAGCRSTTATSASTSSSSSSSGGRASRPRWPISAGSGRSRGRRSAGLLVDPGGVRRRGRAPRPGLGAGRRGSTR